MSGIGMALGALNLAARFPRVARIFAAVPKPVWEALTVLAYVLALFAAHQHYAHAHDARLVKATIERRDGQWRDALAKAHQAAIASRTRHEATATTISTKVKGTHDAQVRHNASAAGHLLRDGPGQAAAAGRRPGDHPGLPAAAGGSGGAAAGAGAAPGQMPSGDGLAGLPVAAGGALHDPGAAQPAADDGALALVPWSWMVPQAQEHDDLLAEVIAWRDWYAKQQAEWEKMRRAAAIADVGHPASP